MLAGSLLVTISKSFPFKHPRKLSATKEWPLMSTNSRRHTMLRSIPGHEGAREPLCARPWSGKSEPGVGALPRTSAPQAGTMLISPDINPAAIWMTDLAQEPCHYIRPGLFTTSRPAHARRVLIRTVRSQSRSKQTQLHQQTQHHTSSLQVCVLAHCLFLHSD